MQLTKHHGLGNDFLVALADLDPSAELARRLCDRRRGIGADGLIVGRPGGSDADITMVLRNSDGSLAAMSGNGIRCLAQAVARQRGIVEGELAILTGGGLRRVIVTATGDPATCSAEVGMGPVRPGPPLPNELPDGLAAELGTADVQAATADIGNPHLVLRSAAPRAVDLARFGAALERSVQGGINVEFIAPTPGRADELDLTVWERGAGITEACGTGASAAAFVAAGWGLVGNEVTVHLPGGDVRVLLGDEVTLIGPATFVATIEIEDVHG